MTFLHLPRQRDMSDWVVLPENTPIMGYFVRDAEIAWNVLTRMAKVAWDIL